MKITKEQFQKEFKNRLNEKYAMGVEDASANELYNTLGSMMRAAYSSKWHHTWKNYLANQQKQVYYFSIEFLPGKLLESNLLNMDWLEVVEESLEDMGIDLKELINVEPDMGLGNGGLGRLASCFMDSIASCGLPGNGNGIRYQYGLFKQKFIDGYQVELPDDWLNNGNVWEVRKDSKAVNVHFFGDVHLEEVEYGKLKPVYKNQQMLRAVPYDTGMIGYKNEMVNTVRLWSVEIPASEEVHYRSIEERRALEDLTAVLYPDDSNEKGRLTRLAQEYFFVSAGIQSIVRYFKTLNVSIHNIHEYVAIHINDTHPALCIPEFMRILLDEEDLTWEEAWAITLKVMSYTNHTIMAEAMEKWSVDMIKRLLPRIYQIIEEIDRRFVEDMSLKVYDGKVVENTKIIKHGEVHMAHLAIIGSHSINGVAKLHSELLKTTVLPDFYSIYPNRFNNKTNGIAQRRWLQLSNRSLSEVLDKTIGTTWRHDPLDLRLLLNYQDDEKVLEEIYQSKRKNKKRLADFIEDHSGIVVSPDAIFDVQIKRLHAYKRQLLNLMHIIKCYQDIKENPESKPHPRVFIFGAKAAPSYTYAKTIIKCINETAQLINNDPDVKDLIKIVFLENYNVSLAELIIPAADVSEQISLATKEASGTSNMKLMLNGAVTLATLDGANIEIRDAVGDENICTFGITKDEVYDYYQNQSYSAVSYYENDPVIRRVIEAFIDGTIPNIYHEGTEIFDSLIRYNDEFFVLRDFKSYVEAQEKIEECYKDQNHWRKMSLRNIAHAGAFTSDETVKNYADEIWHIDTLPNYGDEKGLE
ncbi:glycogen/starch/alpha-glucan phosphorylase [Vagococcus elongatus]|uniref:Alpha-1,4 glucan phosphorylase n=1 Tax=Vagococcus elongatus TaxID=180344 RepID=A0A430B5Q2_9ENTE|nr:glycogen/starch/alpha-glucan phosphorylase [Vagococcus elongatus]RSU15630.1 glucan phosphorylase [Vagococcus elongatus]